MLPRLLTLEASAGRRANELATWMEPFARSNSFNPSAVLHGGLWYVAFRHHGARSSRPFEASLLVGRLADGAPPERSSLTSHAARFGVRNVADPKLVGLGGDLWLTFNDGWSATQNNLYLMRVTPALGPPVLCRYAGRRSVEKNWAFFRADDRLGALYSVDPVRVLNADVPVEGTREIVFRDGVEGAAGRSRLGLTLGTQLADDAGRHYLIAHEKWRVLRWRSYVGRLVRVHDLTGRPRVEVSERRLCHSLRALAGERPKHNPNLLSCTYFSGLDVRDGVALIGYGVNDVRLGFAEAEVDRL